MWTMIKTDRLSITNSLSFGLVMHDAEAIQVTAQYALYHMDNNRRKLEIWSRAQLEAAWRPKFDWKYNLGVVGRVKKFKGATPP